MYVHDTLNYFPQCNTYKQSQSCRNQGLKNTIPTVRTNEVVTLSYLQNCYYNDSETIPVCHYEEILITYHPTTARFQKRIMQGLVSKPVNNPYNDILHKIISCAVKTMQDRLFPV